MTSKKCVFCREVANADGEDRCSIHKDVLKSLIINVYLVKNLKGSEICSKTLNKNFEEITKY